MRRDGSIRRDGDERARRQLGKSGEQFGHEWCSILVTVGAGAQHDYGERDAAQILLVLHVFVHGYKDIEATGGSDLREQATVFNADPAPTLNGGKSMARQVATQTTGQALVEKEAHLGGGEGNSDYEFAPALDKGDRLFTFHGGKIIQKCREAVPFLKVIEQGSHGHAGASEAGGSAHQLRIHQDDFVEFHVCHKTHFKSHGNFR